MERRWQEAKARLSGGKGKIYNQVLSSGPLNTAIAELRLRRALVYQKRYADPKMESLIVAK